MSISTKIQASIESWSELWGKRLNSFLISILSTGLDIFFKVLGKSFSGKLAPLLNEIEATGKVPPILQPLLNEIRNPTGEASALLASQAAGTLVGGALGKMVDAVTLPIAYEINKRTRNVIINEQQALQAWLRGFMPDSKLEEYLAALGLSNEDINYLKQMMRAIFGIGQLIELWKRNKAREPELKAEAKKLGFSDTQWDDAKRLVQVLPTASDVIRFAVREAYTPEIAEKFGQYQDFPEKAMSDAEMIGLSRDLLSKYWASHWDLPATTQGFTMLHRGIISEEELKTLLRALDVMPFWRDRLIKMSYNVLTRVDARRMWDMGILDDAALEHTYLNEGYNPTDAHNLTVWTKVYQTYPDLIARYKNGYISLDTCKQELIALGLTPDRAQWLIEQKIKKQAPERTAKERDLTKAEIIKGLNKGVINEPTAIELLTDMGYNADEAKYIIIINAPKEETQKAKTQKELTKSDILSSLKKGLILEDEAILRLVSIRYLIDDAQFLVSLALATVAPIADTKQKEITKADIVSAVKKGLITAEDGYLLLQDIGYSADSANFILALATTATGGSPDSYTEFKQLTQLYRASQGLKAAPPPQELINAERELQTASDTLNYAKAQKVPTEKLTALEKAVNEATLKYKQLLAKYKQ